MTETSTPLPTHIATFDDQADGASKRLIPDDTSVDLDGQAKSDEDGTIKCICAYVDDDGSTVLCERCGTWQHSECYYYNNGCPLPDLDKIEHHCSDCKPRHLDHKAAHERQKRKREYLGLEETKVKKPSTAKSHKRKMKLSDAGLTNGWSHEKNDVHAFPERDSRSPKENLVSSKRPKTNHRHASSTSTPSSHGHSSNNKRPFMSGANGFASPVYSEDFFECLERDPGDTPMQANLFSDISITSSLSDWSQHVEALSSATSGRKPHDVFEQCDRPVDQMALPHLQKQYIEIKSSTNDGRTVKWTYLTTAQPVHKMSPIGELRGKIGLMHDYCKDPSNQWDHLRHPLPFVFFHPILPIYIDTRNEGTQCRYLRRSCAPNLTLKTFLEGKDYRFCFVAKEDLEAGAELTIGWTLDAHIRNFFAQKGNQELKRDQVIEQDESYVVDWAEKVLATFGGCACNAPDLCSLARYTRSRKHNGVEHGTGALNGKSKQRKLYKRPNLLESVPGSASRASSEGMRLNEDDLVDGNLSTSDSTRSKPRSRDLTPTFRQPSDVNAAPGLEISEREKRKIAAMEKSDHQEHERQQPTQKKKKRNSGNANNANGINHSTRYAGLTSVSQPHTPGLIVKPFFGDAGTNTDSPTAKSSFTVPGPRASTTHKRPSLPNSPLSLQSRPRATTYVDSASQTDRVDGEIWIKAPIALRPARKPYVSLTKRLLKRCREEKITQEKQSREPSTRLPDPAVAAADQPISMNHAHEIACLVPNGAQPALVPDVNPEGMGVLAISSSLPVQKPRPPGEGVQMHDFRSGNHGQHATMGNSEHIPHPATSAGTSSDLPSNGVSNGPHHNDLRLEVQQHIPATLDALPSSSPVLATPSTIQPLTPSLSHSSDNQNFLELQSAASGSSSVQSKPQPIKKKLTFSDYIKRKSDKAEADNHASAAEARSSASPTIQTHVPGRRLESVSEDTKNNGFLVGEGLVATPSQEVENGLQNRTEDAGLVNTKMERISNGSGDTT